MVTELVKTAVAAKCLYDNAGMTGNYECAYSLGLLSYIEGLDEKDQVTELESIYKEVMDNVCKVTTDDNELKPKFDEQMNELYHMGYADKTIR